MRFMIVVKADESTEAGVLPSGALLAKMGALNAEMAAAGVLRGAEGLQASSKGARVALAHGKRTVIDGPFAESKELIAGFTMVEVASKDEAIAWAARILEIIVDEQCPDGAEIEVRKLFEASDFAPAASGDPR
jgi:hypothetical protein